MGEIRERGVEIREGGLGKKFGREGLVGKKRAGWVGEKEALSVPGLDLSPLSDTPNSMRKVAV